MGAGQANYWQEWGSRRGVPALYVSHGRRDTSSPVLTAWDLHRSWPGSTLIVAEGSGHGGAPMEHGWREANDRLVTLVENS